VSVGEIEADQPHSNRMPCCLSGKTPLFTLLVRILLFFVEYEILILHPPPRLSHVSHLSEMKWITLVLLLSPGRDVL
jgi:hypothetical protein